MREYVWFSMVAIALGYLIGYVLGVFLHPSAASRRYTREVSASGVDAGIVGAILFFVVNALIFIAKMIV